MSTYITLEDGRVWATSNGLFDAVLEATATEIAGRPDGLEGLAEWLLAQRCEILGPGVGYLDLRELSPGARVEFTHAFMSAYDRLSRDLTAVGRERVSILKKMWDSIAKGEPPEALTSEHWRTAPHDGTRRGPGWPQR